MLHIGRIEKIIYNDEKNNYLTVTLTWLDMPGGFYSEQSLSAQIKLSYFHISRSFGFQYLPVIGDIVVCGFLEGDYPIIISYLSTDYYNKISSKNPYGYYFRNLVQGEYSLKGLRGNEIYLDRVGSLKFIQRDQNILIDVIKQYNQKIANPTAEERILNENYITTLEKDNFSVDLTKQVADYPKTEVTIGKVYDEQYKEEQKLNDEEIAVQILGKKNTPKYDDNGNLKSVEIEEIYKIQINVEGEISIARKDEEDDTKDKFNITIDKDGNMNILGTQIKIQAKEVVMENKTLIPDGKGSFCALPQCLFTGATHIGSMAQSEEE